MDTAATIHYNRVQGCIGRTLSLMVVGKDQLQIVRGHSICVSPMQIARDVLLPDIHPASDTGLTKIRTLILWSSNNHENECAPNTFLYPIALYHLSL